MLPDVYEEAIKELKLDVVSQPTIDVEKIDKETGVKFIVDVTVKRYAKTFSAQLPIIITYQCYKIDYKLHRIYSFFFLILFYCSFWQKICMEP